MRVALGGPRGRVSWQLLVESAILALVGGAAGLLVALWTVPALLALAPGGRVPRLEMIRIDVWVMAFAFGTSLLTALTCGSSPRSASTRARTPESLLTAGGRSVPARSVWRRTLVVGADRRRAGAAGALDCCSGVSSGFKP